LNGFNGLKSRVVTQFEKEDSFVASNIPLLEKEGWLRHESEDAKPP
jgi:hypothetical protein